MKLRRLHNLRYRAALQLLERRDMLSASPANLHVEFALVSEPTVSDDLAEDRVRQLPANLARTHEWDRVFLEIWLQGDSASPISVEDVAMDLQYATEITSAVDVTFGKAFGNQTSFQIEDTSGLVETIQAAGTQVQVSNADHVLFARVQFQTLPHAEDNVLLNRTTGDIGPHSMQLDAANVAATADGETPQVIQQAMPDPGILPVIYDLNDDHQINLDDFNIFVDNFREVAEAPGDMAWYTDFNKDYVTDLTDFNFFVDNFKKNFQYEHVNFPSNYPEAWVPKDETGGGDGGSGENDPPPPQFELEELQVFVPGNLLPGAQDVFLILVDFHPFQPGVQIDLLAGSVSMSEDVEEGDLDAVLTIVLQDEEILQAEVELIFEGELIDTLAEFQQYGGLVTAYVAEVMGSLRGMLDDFLSEQPST